MKATLSGLIRCPGCSNVLGELAAEVLTSRHKGRVIVAFPVAIQCERCGATWEPERPATQTTRQAQPRPQPLLSLPALPELLMGLHGGKCLANWTA